MSSFFSQGALESVLGVTITNLQLYIVALTHPSAVRYFQLQTHSYERLEFLGDSIIGFVVANWLFQTFPQADEGMMTQMRTRLVSGETLGKLSCSLGLPGFVLMSPRAAAAPRKLKVMADVFESLVGAMYLDAGMLAAKEFILRTIGTYVSLQELLTNKNFKEQLLQTCHRLKVDLPIYDVVANDAGVFTVQVSVDGKRASGRGSTKKEAEQSAAWNVLMGLV